MFDGPGLPHNTDYAIASFRRILMIEPGAPELERLLELLRERADTRLLVTVLTDRITFHEAEALCKKDSKRLCTENEWTFACEGEEVRPYPYGYTRDTRADGLGDFSYHNATLAVTKRWFGKVSNSTRLIGNFGQDPGRGLAKTADGWLVLVV